jgi:hypothetical protein
LSISENLLITRLTRACIFVYSLRGELYPSSSTRMCCNDIFMAFKVNSEHKTAGVNSRFKVALFHICPYTHDWRCLPDVGMESINPCTHYISIRYHIKNIQNIPRNTSARISLHVRCINILRTYTDTRPSE